MKRVLWALLPLTLAVSSVAQVGAPATGLAWRITARDTVSTTHEATEAVMDAFTGELTNRVHRYVAVGSGLNYLDEAGQWVESQDLIELTSDGGAAAIRGPTKVYLKANLNSPGAISLITMRNRVFRTRPLAVVFYDAQSGRVALLAKLLDCVGEWVPPNQIVYKAAFGSLADVRVTCTKAGVESDLIVLQQPVLPEGWNPKTTRLELWHEWLGPPAPRQTAKLIYREADPALREAMLEPDFVDQMLDFGDLWFPTGAAYSADGPSGTATDAATPVRVRDLARESGLIPVAKSWLNATNRNVLVEAVRWEDLQPQLHRLPLTTQSATPAQAQALTESLSQSPTPDAALTFGQPFDLRRYQRSDSLLLKCHRGELSKGSAGTRCG